MVGFSPSPKRIGLAHNHEVTPESPPGPSSGEVAPVAGILSLRAIQRHSSR
jgi:hypothetical protein